MAAIMCCKVRVRIAWNVGRPDFIEVGPFQTGDALSGASRLWERILEAAEATSGGKFPKRVNIELYDFHAEETG